MMAGMDKLCSACGFDFVDTEELIAELPAERTLWDAPAFDQVLYYADPSGIAVTAMEYEGEWTVLPSFRGGEDVEATLYRAMPFIGILEMEDLRWAVLSDAPSRYLPATLWAAKNCAAACGPQSLRWTMN